MSISEKSKQELQELAKDLKVEGYKKLSKVELVAAIIYAQNQDKQNRTESKVSFWGKYSSHIYGIASIVGLVIAIIAFLPKENKEAVIKDKSEITMNSDNEISNNSLAVLPFTNMSTSEENKFFTDGVHDGVLTHLSKISAMKIISRTSVNQYRETDKTITEIGRELGVANILEGSVQRAGDNIRINVQLIDAITDKHLWSEIYDKMLTVNNVFDIQTEIAFAIAKALKTNINPQQKLVLDQRPTENLEAYQAYLHARQVMESRSEEGLTSAQQLLEKAISLDPDFASAFAYLGIVHMSKPYYLIGESFKEQNKIAEQYMELAMAKDDKLPEVFTLKAGLHQYKEEFEQAKQALDKAIELNPNYARAYHWYCNLFRGLGMINNIHVDIPKAYEMIQKAYQLDPLSPSIIVNKAVCEQSLGLLDEAIQTNDEGIQIDPSYPHFWLLAGRIYRNKGRVDLAAIKRYEGVVLNSGNEIYVNYYLWSLIDLRMKDEIFAIIDNFPAEGEDKIARIADLKKQMEIEFPDLPEPVIDRNWGEQVKTGEKTFQTAEIKNWGTSYLPSNSEFQNYIDYTYALYRSGDQEKALELYGKHINPIKDRIDKYLFSKGQHEKYRLEALYLDLQNKTEEQVKLLEELPEQFTWTLSYMDRDPIYDNIRKHPEYEVLLGKGQAALSEQQDNVRSFLKRKE